MDWNAVALTVRLALATTAALALLGLPLAYWLSGTRWRGRFLVESFVALPLVLPPTVVGFYFLMATAPGSLVGGWYGRATGSMLPFTFTGILLASIVANLPFAVRPFLAAFSAVDRRLIEAAWCLGASRRETLLRVALPLAWPGVLAGLVLTFAHTIGEFGIVLMVGGNIPGVTRTLSIAIYDDVQALDYAAAGRTSLVLLLLAFGLLCLVHGFSSRRRPA